MERLEGRSLLRRAPQSDDGQMPTSPEVVDIEIQPDPGLTADESVGRGAGRTPRPATAWPEARRPGGGTAPIVHLIGSGGAESRMWPIAVEPGKVERQFLVHDD